MQIGKDYLFFLKIQTVGGPYWDYKGKKNNKNKRENFFTVVCNRFIELIVSRCPGSQKDFQKGRDKDRDNGLDANCNRTTMLMLCLMLFP